MPSPKTIPKDDGGAPRFLKKIMADGKKKKRKQIIESDDEDGFTNNPSFGDSDDEGPSTRSTRRSTEVPKKKAKLPRKDTDLSVPKKDVPKKKLKDADEGSKKKGTSSLLANMEAPPPGASLLPDKKAPLKGTKMEGKEVLAGAMRILKEGAAKETSVSRAMKEERTKKPNVVDLSTSDQQQQQAPPLTPKRPPGRSIPKQPDPNKLEAFPTVSSPAQPPPSSNPALIQNLVVANKPKKMTPKGRMMMSTLEKMCTKLNDHTQFQMLLRGSLPSTSGVDLSGSFSCDETTAFDFFTYNQHGDIILPAKIAIFPEEFPPGSKEHSLHWWGIVDPAVGARKPNNNNNNNKLAAAPPSSANAPPPPLGMEPKSSTGGGNRGGGDNRGDDYRGGEGQRRSRDRGGGGYHGDRHGGPPPGPGWGGGGGRWEEDYGRGGWEGGRHGGPPPPQHWGGGGGPPDNNYWEGGRRGEGPDGRYWDGGRRGGEPYHNHRGGPPPPNARGRGPPGPMDGRPMDRPPMDRPPPMDGDRPPMDRDRRGGPPPPGFQQSGGRGGRRDRP